MELIRGAHIPPPHMEFALLGNKNQVCRVQVTFRCRSFTKMFRGVVASVAHVRRCCKTRGHRISHVAQLSVRYRVGDTVYRM